MDLTVSQLRDDSPYEPPHTGEIPELPPRAPRHAAARTFAIALVAALSGAAAGALVAHHGRTTITTSASASASGSTAGPLARLASPDITGIVAAVAPAVVSIRTRPANIGHLFESSAAAGEGTGIVIRSDGTIVTTAALIAGGRPIDVTLSDGRTLRATVVGQDLASGLAVLKVDARGLATAQLAVTSRLQVGDDVVALGDALALPGGPVVSRGVVAALQRSVAMQKRAIPARLTGLLEVTTALGAADAGGPVIDTAGEVVGVATTASDGNRPPGFAIDVVRARPVIEALERGTDPSDALGAEAIDVTPDLAHGYDLPVESGALVASVEPRSPAQLAGLRPDDIVVALAHQRVATAEDLTRAVRDPSLTSVRLSVLRGKRPLTLTVRLRK